MDALTFFQAMNLVLSDRPKSHVDGIFFHARSFNGDDDGLFEVIQALVASGTTQAVMVNGGTGEGHDDPSIRAWPGKDDYIQRLDSSACEIFLSKPGSHTLNEGFTFSERAQELGWKSAVVVAQPFQLPRIMCTHVHVMNKRKYPMRGYAVGPNKVDWSKVTSGNQGQPGVSRFDQIQGEFRRLFAYHEQGNLASIEDLINYMMVVRDLI